MNQEEAIGHALERDFQYQFLEDTRLEARDALAHIVAMADKYPEAMLPTPLLAAIEAGRKVL